MKKIELTQGKVAFVDDEDYDKKVKEFNKEFVNLNFK